MKLKVEVESQINFPFNAILNSKVVRAPSEVTNYHDKKRLETRYVYVLAKEE